MSPENAKKPEYSLENEVEEDGHLLINDISKYVDPPPPPSYTISAIRPVVGKNHHIDYPFGVPFPDPDATHELVDFYGIPLIRRDAAVLTALATFPYQPEDVWDGYYPTEEPYYPVWINNPDESGKPKMYQGAISWSVKDNQVSSLTITDVYLSQLPPIIGELAALEDLELYVEKITTLPASFGNLKSLKKFSYLAGSLTTLPESFGNLYSLERLHLQWNKITSLPKSFGNLSNLQMVEIFDNKLKELPQSFGNLESLEDIDFSQNNLTLIPKSIQNLTSLKSLRLEKNKIISLPHTIGALNSLNRLDISENQLSSLPESIGNLSNLRELSVSHNPLSFLPDSIKYLTHLKSFLIYGCNNPALLENSFSILEQLRNLGCYVGQS